MVRVGLDMVLSERRSVEVLILQTCCTEECRIGALGGWRTGSCYGILQIDGSGSLSSNWRIGDIAILRGISMVFSSGSRLAYFIEKVYGVALRTLPLRKKAVEFNVGSLVAVEAYELLPTTQRSHMSMTLGLADEQRSVEVDRC